jgi:hypothetical protein
VEVLFVELHLNGGSHRQDGKALDRAIIEQGFTYLRRSNYTDKNWHTVPVYRRAR